MNSEDLITESVSYAVWGSIVTSCKAFKNVKIDINPNDNCIYAQIELRWWAELKNMEPFRRFWIKRAKINASKHTPSGWSLIVYYLGNNEFEGEWLFNKGIY